jgi:hypothetical protein
MPPMHSPQKCATTNHAALRARARARAWACVCARASVRPPADVSCRRSASRSVDKRASDKPHASDKTHDMPCHVSCQLTCTRALNLNPTHPYPALYHHCRPLLLSLTLPLSPSHTHVRGRSACRSARKHAHPLAHSLTPTPTYAHAHAYLRTRTHAALAPARA